MCVILNVLFYLIIKIYICIICKKKILCFEIYNRVYWISWSFKCLVYIYVFFGYFFINILVKDVKIIIF